MFREPLSRFNLNPPAYAEICKVIKWMKLKGSPCPLIRSQSYAPKNAHIYSCKSPQFAQKFGKQIIFRHLGREQSVY